jgi:hypothetical protein
MPDMQRKVSEMQSKVSDDYADFKGLLKQHDIETEQDIKGDIDWTLLTDESQPLGPNAAYREIERMIDPLKPRSAEPKGPTIGNNRQKRTE